jgi:hypothetical protein
VQGWPQIRCKWLRYKGNTRWIAYRFLGDGYLPPSE